MYRFQRYCAFLRSIRLQPYTLTYIPIPNTILSLYQILTLMFHSNIRVGEQQKAWLLLSYMNYMTQGTI